MFIALEAEAGSAWSQRLMICHSTVRVPFRLDADAGEVAIGGEDQSAAKGVDHAVDLGLDQLAVAGRKYLLDVDR